MVFEGTALLDAEESVSVHGGQVLRAGRRRWFRIEEP